MHLHENIKLARSTGQGDRKGSICAQVTPRTERLSKCVTMYVMTTFFGKWKIDGKLRSRCYFARLVAVPFQLVEGASESRIQARRDRSERTSQVENGEEAKGRGTALCSVTDAFEFPAASGTENSD